MPLASVRATGLATGCGAGTWLHAPSMTASISGVYVRKVMRAMAPFGSCKTGRKPILALVSLLRAPRKGFTRRARRVWLPILRCAAKEPAFTPGSLFRCVFYAASASQCDGFSTPFLACRAKNADLVALKVCLAAAAIGLA